MQMVIGGVVMYVGTYLLSCHAILVCNSLLRPGHESADRLFAIMHPAKGKNCNKLNSFSQMTLQSDNALLAFSLHNHHASLSTADQTPQHTAQLIMQHHNGFGSSILGQKLVCILHRLVDTVAHAISSNK